MLTADIVSAVISGDEITNLNEAMNSPEWQKVMQTELDQLHKMGVWKLTEKLLNAEPIANKWVFIRKQNRQGDIIKYKV